MYSRLSPSWLFSILLGCALTPIIFCVPFPTQDGPAHVDNAALLLRYAGGDATVRQFYERTSFLEPTWVGQSLLAILLIFCSPEAALTLYTLLALTFFALAFRAALCASGGEGKWTALFIPSLIFSAPLFYGFMSMFFGLALGMTLIAHYERARQEKKIIAPWVVVLLSSAAFATHPLGFYVIILYFVSDFFVAIVSSCRSSPDEVISAIRPNLTIGMALIPALLLVLAFVLHHPVSYSWSLSTSTLLDSLIHLEVFPLSASHHVSLLVMALFVLIIAALYRAWRLGTKGERTVAVFFTLLLSSYFFIPNEIGSNALISIRLLLTVMLSALMLVTQLPLTPRLRVFLSLVSALTLIVQLTVLYPLLTRTSSFFNELLELAPHLEPRATFLPLSFSRDAIYSSHLPGQPFLHAGGLISADRTLINLANYQAAMDYFPLRYLPARNPYRILSTRTELEHEPPAIMPLRYQQVSGISIRYLVSAIYSSPFYQPRLILHDE